MRTHFHSMHSACPLEDSHRSQLYISPSNLRVSLCLSPSFIFPPRPCFRPSFQFYALNVLFVSLSYLQSLPKAPSPQTCSLVSSLIPRRILNYVPGIALWGRVTDRISEPRAHHLVDGADNKQQTPEHEGS